MSQATKDVDGDYDESNLCIVPFKYSNPRLQEQYKLSQRQFYFSNLPCITIKQTGDFNSIAGKVWDASILMCEFLTFLRSLHSNSNSIDKNQKNQNTVDHKRDAILKRNLIKVCKDYPMFGNLTIKDQTILELGAGLALPSIVCAMIGASKVYCTDIEPKELEIAKFNIESNLFECKQNDTDCDINTTGSENHSTNVSKQCKMSDSSLKMKKVLIESNISRINLIKYFWGTNLSQLFKKENNIIHNDHEKDKNDQFFDHDDENENKYTQASKNNNCKIDIVLGSDLLYLRECYKPLFITLCDLLHANPNIIIIFSFRERFEHQKIFYKMIKKVFDITYIDNVKQVDGFSCDLLETNKVMILTGKI